MIFQKSKNVGGVKSADALLQKIGFQQAPIDPFSVAEKLGLEIDQWMEVKDIQTSGSIKKSRGKVSVWLNPLDPKRRQNFTLAHEIGHYVRNIKKANFVFHDTPKDLYKVDHENAENAEANSFAYELLMPKEEVFRIGEEIIQNNDDKELPIDQFLELMANRFEVSKQVMFFRLKSLNIIT